MKKETGIIVDEVSGKRYKLLRWNQKPDGRKGDQACATGGVWVGTCALGEYTVKELTKNFPTDNTLTYRRPLPV